MSNDRRPGQVWIIKFNGAEETRLKPGETVEIGRKPLRPLADDGRRRLEVPDQTKSMSKRHAIFAVDQDGLATLRDMGSTNGSYLIQSDGSLVRLPVDAAFPLSSSSARFQFGDVPVDFVRISNPEEDKTEPSTRVPDLFSYSTQPRGMVEPDAAEMSVDDILDMRAGEPTGIFKADGVRNRVTALHDMALGAAKTADSSQEADSVSQDRPRSAPVARDSQDNPSQPFSDEAASADSRGSRARYSDDSGSAERGQANRGPADAGSADGQESDRRRFYADQGDRRAGGFQAQSARGEARRPLPWQEHESEQGLPLVGAQEEDSQPVDRDLFADARRSRFAESASDQNRYDQDADDARDARGHRDDRPASVRRGEADSAQGFTPLGAVELARLSKKESDQARRPQPADEQGDGQRYQPAFEPGSVFERVSKGDYDRGQEAIVVDGMSSDDAKRTADFALQFAMAKHRQLLPFLAMNPALYDDLYAWLEAQGDQDIDAALRNNDGYHEYLNAVRK
ncbi:FHA domain-containing protein [uncultured Bifidobacterium sp.]|uniref:variant leucine-rich repeat-containing protein n=1 Tax=uncultured Bifidobacterium sp. TaxID=165187 RepID=UPI0025FEA0FF|nr:FHA domain-containing protein [uncultured Bifidobacterium sp.]